MPTDEPKGGGPPDAFLGFEHYADDTPRSPEAPFAREPEPRSWAAADAWGEPLTFHAAEPAEPAPERGRSAWPMAAVGVAVLAAFGGGYLLARSDGPPPTATAPRPVTEAAAMAAAEPMNLEVAKPTPIPVPPLSSTAKLEVLPANPGPVASLAPRPLPPLRESPLLRIAPAPPVVQAPAQPPPAPREVAEAAPPRDAAAVEPAPVRTSFDCRDAPTPARAMVCRDGGLAAMDRRMKQAYAAALASGAPEEELAADQRDWLAIREEAARYSRRSVANIYRQRIDELEAMSDRSWR
jgi:uncharacterized protein YecT (DUF1311 family)